MARRAKAPEYQPRLKVGKAAHRMTLVIYSDVGSVEGRFKIKRWAGDRYDVDILDRHGNLADGSIRNVELHRIVRALESFVDVSMDEAFRPELTGREV
jgi:hypothetical protein